MNKQFMTDEELDVAIDRAAKAMQPIGYSSERERELRRLHHGALVWIKQQREREAKQ